jgi:hypothetical protein
VEEGEIAKGCNLPGKVAVRTENKNLFAISFLIEDVSDPGLQILKTSENLQGMGGKMPRVKIDLDLIADEIAENQILDLEEKCFDMSCCGEFFGGSD